MAFPDVSSCFSRRLWSTDILYCRQPPGYGGEDKKYKTNDQLLMLAEVACTYRVYTLHISGPLTTELHSGNLAI